MATCLANQFFAEALRDCVRVLNAQGCAVSVPRTQTCCGQPAFNAGHAKEALQIARHTARVFQQSDYVVTPSGSCAAMVKKHYHDLGGGESEWRDTALELGKRTFELSEFLVDVLDVTSLGDGLEGRRLVLHPGCHGLRDLGLQRQAVRLLERAGAKILPWEADRECCGFGGLFAAKLAPVSLAMADRKLDTLPRTGVTLTSMDAGCLLQLGGRIRQRNLETRVVHLASLFAEAAGVRA